VSPFTRSRPLLGVGRRALGLLAAGACVEQARVAEVDLSEGHDVREAVRGVLQAPAARGVDVVLSDAVCRFFTVRPPSGVARLADLAAFAALRFEDLFGARVADWRIEADWRARAEFLACAAPQSMLVALEDAARSARCALAALAPLFVRTCNATPQAATNGVCWRVCRTSAWITAAFYCGRDCRFVRSTAFDSGRDVETWLAQEAMLADLDAARAGLVTAKVAPAIELIERLEQRLP
jgi:hypothetical protein